MYAKLIRSLRKEADTQKELEKLRKIVQEYAEAGRRIALYLQEFCNWKGNTTYSEMLAEAAEKAAVELEKEREARRKQADTIKELREEKYEQIQQIDKLKGASGWISVKERLPEEFTSALVYVPGLKPFPTVHEGYIAHGEWNSPFLYGYESEDITHWRPMPEPPDEE